MPDCAWLNIPESSWMAFILHSPLSIGTIDYFLEEKIFDFLKVAKCIWFVFCFRLNIFIGKISNLLLPLGAMAENPQS